MIRVLIADDSALVAEMLWHVFDQDPEIEIVGVARNGVQAVELVEKLKPDILTMDIHMPEMDGLEATKQIMDRCPLPILILSASVFKFGTQKAFEALACGALDVMEKTCFEANSVDEESTLNLIERVKLLSRIKVAIPVREKTVIGDYVQPSTEIDRSRENQRIIGIVASTGGPQTLAAILKKLPQSLPVPIVLVQHMTAGFSEGFADWLSKDTGHQVKVAEDHEMMQAGIIYLAPTGLHMKVVSKEKICLSDEDKVDGQKPSGTVLLESVAEHFEKNALGIVLTGMGRDGAQGLRAIRDRSGYTIAQDQQSSIVFGMPKEAIQMGAAREVISMHKMADAVKSWLKI
ncbi:MAG: chemotaxis-specific protein-glutamate methyltransferase CheB [Candidatus Omnitrophica bacterium]|nr:chemotaxis-specific protein-glutamate methyltransferase CheB [Candidatus Omnitrophota bacterium]